MVLYCLDTPTFQYDFIAHKKLFYNHEEVVVLIDQNMFKSRGLLSTFFELKEKGIFQDLILGDLFCKCNLDYSEKEYEDYVKAYYDKFFINYKLDDFDSIITFTDNWDGRINLYFNLIQRKYIWAQSNSKSFYLTVANNAVLKASSSFLRIMNKYVALSPLASCAVPHILYNCDSILIEKLNGKRYTIWDPEEGINLLTDSELEKIVSSYSSNEIVSNSNILMLNSYGYLFGNGNLSENELEIIGNYKYSKEEIFSIMNKIALDYFADLDNKIYIKPHPNDPISDQNVKALYGENVELLTYAPWQIFQRYCISKKIIAKKIIGYASTSLASVSNKFAEKNVCLGEDFVKTWPYFDSLFVLVQFTRIIKSAIVTNDPIYNMIMLIAEQMNVSMQMENVGKLEFKEKQGEEIYVFDYKAIVKSEKLYNLLNKVNMKASVVFVNVDSEDFFIDEEYRKYLSPICIKKRGEYKGSLDYQLARNEIIWVFSKNNKIHRMVYDFEFKYYTPFRRLFIEVERISHQEAINRFNQEYWKSEIKKMHTLRESINEIRLNANFLSFRICDQLSQLRKVNRIEIYLDLVRKIENRYLIIMAIKDTPGDRLSDEVVEQVHALGFALFKKDLWQMYIGISLKGIVLCDFSGEKKEMPLNYTNNCSGNQLEICVRSEAWRKGNVASIMINKTEYALNRRGINLVIYDVDNEKLVDSIAYDAHTTDKRFYR